MALTRSLENFLTGLRTPLLAARMILGHRTLFLWSLLPTLVTLLLYGWGFWELQSSLQDWLSQTLAPRGWDSWLIRSLSWLSRILIVFVGALTFAFVAGVVAAPFNDFLAETAESYTRPPMIPAPSPSLPQRVRLIGIDIMKTVAGLGLTIVGLLCSWIPVLNILGFTMILLVMAFNYVSYAQTRRGVGLYGSLRFLFQNFALCMGFGLVMMLAFSVPFLSIVALPIAVVGGTQLVASRTARIPA